MRELTITQRQARRFILAHQGLWPPGALVIKNWRWEPQVAPSENLQCDLRSCFARFLIYLLRLRGP